MKSFLFRVEYAFGLNERYQRHFVIQPLYGGVGISFEDLLYFVKSDDHIEAFLMSR